ARNASSAQLHGAHAALAEMAGEDAVFVVVEARRPARLQHAGELVLRARGADVAPAVHDVDLGGVASAVVLDHPDRAAPRPRRAREPGERGRGARVVQMQVLLPGAYAGAAPELVAEAGPAAAALHAERLQAEPLLVGERAQRLQRRAPRAGDAADQGQRLGV